MRNPFERDPHDRPDPAIEAALRASLDAHAAEAPRGDELAEQIIASAAAQRRTVTPPAPHRSWGRYTLPAAAAVVAAIAGITIAFFASNSDRDAPPVAGTSHAPEPTVSIVPTVSPSTTISSPSPQSDATTSVDTTSLHDVTVLDLSFTSTDSGWGLASAQCIDNPSQRCTAIIRTTDGTTWTSHPGDSPFDVDGVTGTAPMVSHIRFATNEIGYVYGPDALFMTTDGGATWQRQKGGALGLETANGNVARLVSANGTIGVQTSRIGTTTWHDQTLGAAAGVGQRGASMARTGRDVYVLLVGLPQGGTWDGSLFRSSDDGVTWTAAGDPCRQVAGGAYRSTGLAAGQDSRLALTCRSPQTAQAALVTSGDAGASFDTASLPQREGLLAVGPPGVYLLALDSLSRTTDSGAHWRDTLGITPSYVWIGFESADVGRIVTDGGTNIWTTENGGSTWTEVELP